MVDDGLLREGQQAVIRRGSGESDVGMVPEKPAKTRVTPVESVEGRAAAEGKSAHGNAHRAFRASPGFADYRRARAVYHTGS